MTIDMTYFGQGVGLVITFYLIGSFLGYVKGAIMGVGR